MFCLGCPVVPRPHRKAGAVGNDQRAVPLAVRRDELAVNTLRQLETQNRPQDAGRMIEYRQLIADLERELSESLDAMGK
jgi:hypothetical protein